MSNKEQMLLAEIKRKDKTIEELRSRLIPLNGVDEYIASQNKIIDKYNNWFQYNREWINAYNRAIRWSPDQGMVGRYRVPQEDLDEPIRLMRERIEHLHDESYPLAEIEDEGTLEDVEESTLNKESF